MKKSLKITLIVAVAIIILGIAAFCLALILQLDLKGLNPTKYVTNEHRPTEQFTSISIDCAECSVRLIPSMDGENSVICRESERITHSVEVVGGTLTIRRHDERRWYEHFGLSHDKMAIELYLTEAEFASIDVTTKSGDVEISDQFTFDEAAVQTSSGDISFSANVNQTVRAQASSGDVYVGWGAPLQIDVQTSSGDITLDGITSEAKVSLHASSGDVKAYSVSCSELSVDTSSGSVELFANTVYGDLTVDTSSGSVKLDYTDADYIKVHTSSGSVSGIMPAGKDYRVSSSSGSISVPPSGNDGVCEVKTSSGSITFTTN